MFVTQTQNPLDLKRVLIASTKTTWQNYADALESLGEKPTTQLLTLRIYDP